MTLKESKPKQRRGFVQFCSAPPEILSTGSLWADCTRPSCKNTIQIQIWIVNLSNKAIELFPAVMQQTRHMLKLGPIFSSGHAAFLTIGLYSSKGCYKVHVTICDLTQDLHVPLQRSTNKNDFWHCGHLTCLCSALRSVGQRQFSRGQRRETLYARFAVRTVKMVMVIDGKWYSFSLFQCLGMFLLGFWDRGSLHNRKSGTFPKG